MPRKEEVKGNDARQALRDILTRVKRAMSECANLHKRQVETRRDYVAALDEHGPTVEFLRDPRERPWWRAEADADRFLISTRLLVAEAKGWVAIYGPDGALQRIGALRVSRDIVSEAALTELLAFMQQFDTQQGSLADPAKGEGPDDQAIRATTRRKFYESKLKERGEGRLSLLKFSLRVDIDGKTLRNWLKGRAVQPQTRAAIAEGLGVSVKELPR